MERNGSTAGGDDDSRFRAIMQEAGFRDGFAPPFELNISDCCVGCPVLRREMKELAGYVHETGILEKVLVEEAREESEFTKTACRMLAMRLKHLREKVEKTQAMVEICAGTVETSGVNNSTGEEVHATVCGSPKSGTQSEDEPATVTRGRVKTMEEELSGWLGKPGGSAGSNQDQ